MYNLQDDCDLKTLISTEVIYVCLELMSAC